MNSEHSTPTVGRGPLFTLSLSLASSKVERKGLPAKGFLLIALLVIAALAGCGGLSGPKDFSAPLQEWVEQQQYSSWEAFRGPGEKAPRRPDGLTLGNRHIFAGIGCSTEDLSQIEPLFGDEKSLRALASPLTLTIEKGNEALPLAKLDEQRLRRVESTSIAVSESKSADFLVTTVDYAPTGEDLNCLVRLVLVSNEGEKEEFGLTFSSALGDLKQENSSTITAGRLGIISDHRLRLEEEGISAVKINLGSIPKGESRSAAIVFVPARDAQKMQEGLDQAKKIVLQDPLGVLETTRKEWEDWRGQVKVSSGKEKLDDLIDSILCLIRSHIGFEAIHTGSLRYPHTRAWVRDNYWVQRALLEAGLAQEAKLNLDFFFSAWKESGLCSYYEISTRRGEPYGNPRVELPHYLVLMVRDAEKMAGVDAKPYWPMVKGCLEGAGMAENGLQPINADETWLLAAGIDQLDYVLDNSLLLIASSEYGANLAGRVGDGESAQKFGDLAKKARQAAESSFFSSRLGRFTIARAGSGSSDRGMDEFPNAGVLARPVIFALYPADDPRIRTGLLHAWRDLFDIKKGLRAYSRSNVVDGGTPGYFLYAASEARLPVSHLLVNRTMLIFCSATGNVWELQSVVDPKWGLEKRRLWDSAVLLMGLLKYCRLQDSIPPYTDQPPVESAVQLITQAKSGPAILEQNSPNHARELVTQLARHFGAKQMMGEWSGTLPYYSGHVILISPTLPHPLKIDASRPGGDNYYICKSKVPIAFAKDRLLVWVKNRGDVFADLRGLEYDLFRAAIPVRDPAAFPDSDLKLLSPRFARGSLGSAEVKITCDKPIPMPGAGEDEESQSAQFSMELSGHSAARASSVLEISSKKDDPLAGAVLSVSAHGGPKALAKVEVAFPPGYWVVEARGLDSKWDRTTDPIDEIHRKDGSRVFVFQIHLGPGVDKSFNFRLTRPGTIEVPE
ncbi:MAG: hypothetical protein GTO55_10650 [Armatimonadetes bacterium]|nr:hypothetical protein [Armatimonadota bacterium]NIM24691.1 hypothetical protein [Armatimonadota bacterium]NIM68571.1 hypothetical protein [Armatimonadota bacterium]NIM77088.1 hypothetical protein [Armatimonadota bacterium]NIN06765.1 hypothetical protein [Armatimonadota bacterium]